jgi:hypothetical protein
VGFGDSQTKGCLSNAGYQEFKMGKFGWAVIFLLCTQQINIGTTATMLTVRWRCYGKSEARLVGKLVGAASAQNGSSTGKVTSLGN